MPPASISPVSFAHAAAITPASAMPSHQPRPVATSCQAASIATAPPVKARLSLLTAPATGIKTGMHASGTA